MSIVDDVMGGTILLSPRDGFDDAIIGHAFTEDGIAAVYSKNKIIAFLKQTMSYDDAVDYFNYNTVRGIEHLEDKNKPIIVYDLPGAA